jgi:hypothetical protein
MSNVKAQRSKEFQISNAQITHLLFDIEAFVIPLGFGF